MEKARGLLKKIWPPLPLKKKKKPPTPPLFGIQSRFTTSSRGSDDLLDNVVGFRFQFGKAALERGVFRAVFLLNAVEMRLNEQVSWLGKLNSFLWNALVMEKQFSLI